MSEKIENHFIVQNTMTGTNNHDQTCILLLKYYSASETYTHRDIMSQCFSIL